MNLALQYLEYSFIWISIAANSQDIEGPWFSAPMQNVTVVAGREARMSCTVENLQNYKVAWVHSCCSKRSAVLTVGTHVLTTNRRISVLSERNSFILIISNTTKVDRGQYMCQISTVPPKKMFTTLEVQVPPHISHPPGDVTVTEGEDVTLNCNATGDPQPRIAWRREDGDPVFKNGTSEWKGGTLLLPSVSRHDSKAFLCVASNGIPPAVSARVQIFVKYAPFVNQNVRQREWASVGDFVDASCEFNAFPRPSVSWSRVGEEKNLEFEVHNEVSSFDKGVSKLFFRPVVKENFGVYKCQIQNSIGEARMMFHLNEIITTTTTTTTTTSTTTTTTPKPTTTEESTTNEPFSLDRPIIRSNYSKFSNSSKDAEFDRQMRENSLSEGFYKVEAKLPYDSARFSSAEYNHGSVKIDPKGGEQGDTNTPNRFVQEFPLENHKVRPFKSDQSTSNLENASKGHVTSASVYLSSVSFIFCFIFNQ